MKFRRKGFCLVFKRSMFEFNKLDKPSGKEWMHETSEGVKFIKRDSDSLYEPYSNYCFRMYFSLLKVIFQTQWSKWLNTRALALPYAANLSNSFSIYRSHARVCICMYMHVVFTNTNEKWGIVCTQYICLPSVLQISPNK